MGIREIIGCFQVQQVRTEDEEILSPMQNLIDKKKCLKVGEIMIRQLFKMKEEEDQENCEMQL